MKLYNCPDYTHTEDTCENCTRYKPSFNRYERINEPYTLPPIDLNNFALPCKTCPNNPSSGGSGLCNCNLGIRWDVVC